MLSYEELRNAYPEFIYQGYQIEEDDKRVRVEYQFEIPGLSAFLPVWEFPKQEGKQSYYRDNKTFHEMVFSLGMVELISYWKLTCSPLVRILAGSLAKEQMEWWRNLYYHGLGEFYYTNHIIADEKTFMRLVSEGIPVKGVKRPLTDAKGCLIPIGGGKDSAVTLELLKEEKETNCCYIINPRGATMQTVKAGGYDKEQTIAVKRTLDANMLALNKQGFLNGHTPFSAIVAFSATIAAYMRGLRFIVLSNESSANESTVEGSYVNHQYSKSFQFEKDFHEYEKTYVQSGTYYFSMLRPLSEFQIARYFASCMPYHDIFRSCNAGSKEDIWCGHCPKCLFVYIILSPFLPQRRLQEIFGKNMLADEGMKHYLDQLIGLMKEKPFECVGSRDEINTALALAVKALEREGNPLPVLLSYYQGTDCYEQYRQDTIRYDAYYDKEHLLPLKYDAIIKNRCLGRELGEK